MFFMPSSLSKFITLLLKNFVWIDDELFSYYLYVVLGKNGKQQKVERERLN